VAREPSPAWPSLGISTRAGDQGRRQVIDVEKDSPARGKIEDDDVILTIGDATVDSREALNRAIARYDWGDVATLVVRRGERELTVAVPLRRTP
jgi:S1-C subfamily serine protease